MSKIEGALELICANNRKILVLLRTRVRTSSYLFVRFYCKMADPRLRQLKIKTGVVKRLAKEKIVYEKECDQQRAYVEKIKRDGKDEYEIRKQEEVLQESLMMVPDCQRRLVRGYEDLNNLVENEHDLKNTEDYQIAIKVLEEAKLQLPKPGEVLHMC